MAMYCFDQSKPKSETCDSECFIFMKFSHLLFISLSLAAIFGCFENGVKQHLSQGQDSSPDSTWPIT